ncbi:MAG: EAL domain-containing protein [Crocosphaera sp.]
MSEKSLRVNLKQQTWQKLQQYCQASGKVESEVIEELITSRDPSLILENEDQFQQFRRFSQTLPVPIILLRTPTGKIEYANNKALSILGFNLETLSSLSILDLCEEIAIKQKLNRQFTQGNFSKNYELKLRKENNQYLYASIFIQPLPSLENMMIISWCDLTLRHEIEEELKEKKRFLQLVLDNIPQLIFWKDTNSVFVGCNRLWAKASGMKDPKEVGGKTDDEIYNDPNNKHLDPPKNNLDYYRQQDLRVLRTGEPELNFVEHKRNQEGEEVWYNTNKIPIKDADENIVGVMGTIENITERKLVERDLFQEKELAKVTLKCIGEAFIATNTQGIIKEFNPMAEQLTGWTAQEAIENPISTIFQLIDEEGNKQENPLYPVLKNGQSEKEIFVGTLVAKDKEQYKIDMIITPILDQESQILGAVLIFRDITAFSKITAQLSWDATHDTLTGLVNQQEFKKQLSLALESSKNENIEHSLCYLDLDRFKIVNDSCGHAAGDELLQQITYLLQERIRNSDVLARLGGDEFALLLKGCSLEKAEIIANMLRQLVKEFRFTCDNKFFPIGVSIGIVPINNETTTASALLRAADRACYKAKDQGRNRVYIYQADDFKDSESLGQNQWIKKLNAALTEDDFYLYSQKILPLQSSTKVHYEILLRLADSSGNLIAPLAFIPTAERYNLMAEIDQWVIKNFLKTYHKNEQKPSLNHIYMINLSAISLKNEQLIDFIEEQLSYYSVNPQILCFEIRETLAISNLTQTIKFIESIKKLGCSVAIDNFGSGITSLSYLKYWAVDYLKIDENFIQNLTQDEVNYAVVDCFHRISNVMNMETIAECVEHQQTLDILQRIGIDYAQGFAIESPIPLSF